MFSSFKQLLFFWNEEQTQAANARGRGSSVIRKTMTHSAFSASQLGLPLESAPD